MLGHTSCWIALGLVFFVRGLFATFNCMSNSVRYVCVHIEWAPYDCDDDDDDYIPYYY
jgi:hypothetical protein